MTEPTPDPGCYVAGVRPKDPLPPPGGSWFQTRDGRRYCRDLGVIIFVKLALLVVLYYALIMPWPRSATAPGAVAQHLYSLPAPASRHD